MKYTLLITQRCNLDCAYCYIGKRPRRMSLDTARKVVDFVFGHAALGSPAGESLDVAFFGGEPLLEFNRLRDITHLLEDHPGFDPCRVHLAVVSNGTVFTDEIADFLRTHRIGLDVSCDGPSEIHDRFRRFRNGQGSSARVERTLRWAQEALSLVLVNAVYRPETLRRLPETVRYLSALGLRQIYLNPDFTADWRPADLEVLPRIYRQLGRLYVDFLRAGDRHFLSLLDGKVAAILRGGYAPQERCRMGRGELAFTPEGAIYPCERLVGAGPGDPEYAGDDHCIGHVDTGIDPRRTLCLRFPNTGNPECLRCGVRNHCMHSCGCSNFFSTGSYHRVGAFLCASERAALATAFDLLTELEAEELEGGFGGQAGAQGGEPAGSQGYFYDHAGGLPAVPSRLHGQVRSEKLH